MLLLIFMFYIIFLNIVLNILRVSQRQVNPSVQRKYFQLKKMMIIIIIVIVMKMILYLIIILIIGNNRIKWKIQISRWWL